MEDAAHFFSFFTPSIFDHNSFEGPDWGFNSSGAQRAGYLRAIAQAIEDDKDVSLSLNHSYPCM